MVWIYVFVSNFSLKLRNFLTSMYDKTSSEDAPYFAKDAIDSIICCKTTFPLKFVETNNNLEHICSLSNNERVYNNVDLSWRNLKFPIGVCNLIYSNFYENMLDHYKILPNMF